MSTIFSTEMSLIVLITISITHTQNGQYVSSVPNLISDIFAIIGSPCSISDECNELYEIPANMTAEWICSNDTESFNATICQFFECASIDDCNANEECFSINKCDSDNRFYEEYSTICYAPDLCNIIKTESPWSGDSMCFNALNGTYYSYEETTICGGECPEETQPCLNTEKATNCDEICCDGYDSACVALLSAGISAILVGILLLFCFIFRSCKRPTAQAQHAPKQLPYDAISFYTAPPTPPTPPTPCSPPGISNIGVPTYQRSPTDLEWIHIDVRRRGSEEKEPYELQSSTINNGGQNEDGTRTSIPLTTINGVTGINDVTQFENEMLEDLFEID